MKPLDQSEVMAQVQGGILLPVAGAVVGVMNIICIYGVVIYHYVTD
jgi:hypothetical protein